VLSFSTTPRATASAIGGEGGGVAVQLGLEQANRGLRHRIVEAVSVPIGGAAPIAIAYTDCLAGVLTAGVAMTHDRGR